VERSTTRFRPEEKAGEEAASSRGLAATTGLAAETECAETR